MFAMIWPLALVVFSNTLYQICAKSVPGKASPFAALTVTYLVGALVTAVLHFALRPGENFFRQIGEMNWAPYVLGLVIVGLEVGWIYAYKAGWQVSTGSIVQNAFLAVLLVFVGALLYKEPVSWNKLLGIGICLAGLAVMSRG